MRVDGVKQPVSFYKDRRKPSYAIDEMKDFLYNCSMLQNIEQTGKGGGELPNKTTNRKKIKQKKALGKLLKSCRGEISLRKVAEEIGLSPSNLKYIEDGVNAPTGEVFRKLILILNPDTKTRTTMDELYMAIREVPPPDVCDIIIKNQALISVLRPLDGLELNTAQIQEMKKCILSMAEETKKGETQNVED